jgi:hypothetical protein
MTGTREAEGGLFAVRSRVFITMVLAGIAGAIGSAISTVVLEFKAARGLSITCWIRGHED